MAQEGSDVVILLKHMFRLLQDSKAQNDAILEKLDQQSHKIERLESLL